jgi:hypothetical protein
MEPPVKKTRMRLSREAKKILCDEFKEYNAAGFGLTQAGFAELKEIPYNTFTTIWNTLGAPKRQRKKVY